MTFYYFFFKDYVAARNKTGRLQDVKGLFQEAREKANEKGIWAGAVAHCRGIEAE